MLEVDKRPETTIKIEDIAYLVDEAIYSLKLLRKTVSLATSHVSKGCSLAQTVAFTNLSALAQDAAKKTHRLCKEVREDVYKHLNGQEQKNESE